MCVFFKSRGGIVALFLLYLKLYIVFSPLKQNIFSLKEKIKTLKGKYILL